MKVFASRKNNVSIFTTNYNDTNAISVLDNEKKIPVI